jgi:hypothetical protein
MKVIIRALLASLLIHAVYILSMILIGYFQTKAYVPGKAIAFHKIDLLQNEVAFGVVVSPLFGVFSFSGVAVVCGIGFLLYKKWNHKMITS